MSPYKLKCENPQGFGGAGQKRRPGGGRLQRNLPRAQSIQNKDLKA